MSEPITLTLEDDMGKVSFEVGEKVAVTLYGFGGGVSLGVVQRLTRTQAVVLCGGREKRFRLSDGRAVEAPSSTWNHSPYVTKLTQGHVDAINRVRLESVLRAKADAVKNPSMTPAAEVERLLRFVGCEPTALPAAKDGVAP